MSIRVLFIVGAIVATSSICRGGLPPGGRAAGELPGSVGSGVPLAAGDRVLPERGGRYDLSDEIPPNVQIAVSARSRPPRIVYPPTDVLRFDGATFELGLSSLEAAAGESIRIYSPTRTVVDLLRFRGRFGEPLAYGALQRYLRRREAHPAELLRLAAELDVHGPTRRALDVAVAQ